jgi:glutamate/tyrosine decarboxylase-like PLP-dependent enzyme
MYPQLEQDLAQLDPILQQLKDFSANFLAGTPQRRTYVNQYPQPLLHLPAQGAGADDALAQFRERYEKRLAANSGGRYWGFVTGGTTPAAIAGDWLTGALDMNAADGSGLPAHLEREAILMLRELLMLPDAFEGYFVTGATMANFSGLAVARQWLGQRMGVDVAQEGMAALANAKIVAGVPHSSSVKSMAMLGFGRNALELIPAMPEREAIDIEALKAWLAANSHHPVIVLASAGTVNTVDFDDLQALAVLKEQYGFWLHVDAAFGAFATCHPDSRRLIAGWEAADSITVDAHKWLNVPYESGMIFCRHASLQLDTFKNSGAAYLGDPSLSFRYSNYTPENSRRLRALPAWFSLVAYGAEGYAAIVSNNIRQAKRLGQLIEESDAFTLLAPVYLNGVCFTLKDPNETDDFMEALANSGKGYMTGTFYNGVPAIRASFVNWRTTDDDVEAVWHIMQNFRLYQNL